MAGVSNWKWGHIAQKQEQTDGRSPEQIFTILLDTAIMSEHELAECCRKNGLYAEQIRLGKLNGLTANMPHHRQLAEVQKATRGEKHGSDSWKRASSQR